MPASSTSGVISTLGAGDLVTIVELSPTPPPDALGAFSIGFSCLSSACHADLQ